MKQEEETNNGQPYFQDFTFNCCDIGERISLAITLLLAMTVFMLVVADIIPATSDVVPLVGIFFSASMIEMVAMIVVLCYIMRLYHKGPNDPPMSEWMRK